VGAGYWPGPTPPLLPLPLEPLDPLEPEVPLPEVPPPVVLLDGGVTVPELLLLELEELPGTTALGVVLVLDELIDWPHSWKP
jgi:hypothetical protein